MNSDPNILGKFYNLDGKSSLLLKKNIIVYNIMKF